MSTFNAYVALSDTIDADVSRDARMSHRTTWRIGGPADLVVVAHTLSALKKTLQVLEREQIDWVILGKGSNVLVGDEGYRGCVISLGRDFSRIASDIDARTITAGGGALTTKLVTESLKRGLSGVEMLAGVPGTIGGAISMNAGSRREWLGHVVSDVVTLASDGKLKRYEGSDVNWGYRSTSLPSSEIVLEATLALAQADSRAISADIEQRLRVRRTSQPMGRPSCGSVFRNPAGHSAGQMLEGCGCKGYRVGGAEVSQTHANFIVNVGGATAADVLAVMQHMHESVRQTYGIDLQPEVKFLGI